MWLYFLLVIMAMSTNQAWVSAEVKQGSTTVVTPTIVTATDEDTFGSLSTLS